MVLEQICLILKSVFRFMQNSKWRILGTFEELNNNNNNKILEFLLYCSGIDGVLGALGRRFHPWPSTVGYGSGVAAAVAYVTAAAQN